MTHVHRERSPCFAAAVHRLFSRLRHRPGLVAGIAALLSAPALPAAEVIHYWDFDTLQDDFPVDVIGGVTTSPVGTPDVSVHEEYGEAYEGSGHSLNSNIATPDYLLADVFDEGTGTATALDLGTDDFSFSYWSYNASDLDGDVRGPRVFDALRGTEVGIQLASNAGGVFNYRMDDDAGGSIISNNILGDIMQPDAAWVHVAINVSRTENEAEIFFNAESQGSYDISVLTANIMPTQDMQVGVINNGTSAGAAQQSGLDDLAFYSGTLGADEIAGLALAELIPTDITGAPGAPFTITRVEVDFESGQYTLEWNSVSGAIYAVDFSTSLEPLWNEVVDDVDSGGQTTGYSDSIADLPARIFWRIRRIE